VLDSLASIPGAVRDFLFFATASKPTLEPIQPPNHRVQGALVPRIKRPEREADHSPPPSTEVKNA